MRHKVVSAIGALAILTIGTFKVNAADSTALVPYTQEPYQGWQFSSGVEYFNGVAQAQTFLRASDVTLKNTFNPYLGDDLAALRAITPWTFIWNDNGLPGFGFKAQELAPVLPRGSVLRGVNGKLGLDDTSISAYLWYCVKTLDTEVQRLHHIEDEVQQLKAEIAALKQGKQQ